MNINGFFLTHPFRTFLYCKMLLPPASAGQALQVGDVLSQYRDREFFLKFESCAVQQFMGSAQDDMAGLRSSL